VILVAYARSVPRLRPRLRPRTVAYPCRRHSPAEFPSLLQYEQTVRLVRPHLAFCLVHAVLLGLHGAGTYCQVVQYSRTAFVRSTCSVTCLRWIRVSAMVALSMDTGMQRMYVLAHAVPPSATAAVNVCNILHPGSLATWASTRVASKYRRLPYRPSHLLFTSCTRTESRCTLQYLGSYRPSSPPKMLPSRGLIPWRASPLEDPLDSPLNCLE
jgi:hypothetical protein